MIRWLFIALIFAKPVYAETQKFEPGKAYTVPVTAVIDQAFIYDILIKDCETDPQKHGDHCLLIVKEQQDEPDNQSRIDGPVSLLSPD